MVFSLFPALFNNPVKAATTSQNNIVARADYFYNLTWTAQSTVYGWNYNYTFYAGSTYRVPYGQPINSGAYVGYYVSIEDFLSAANTAGSVFYTSRSTYDSTSSVYYATDCSAFVSWCWGVDRKTTYSIPQISTYIGMATASNAYSLQLGDALNSNDVGHVVLVTDLVYSGSTLTSIEITEQTPPQMKRSYYTPSELGAKYGTYYGIYRYSGEVPAAPDGSTNDDSGSSSTGSTTTITSKYYPACDSSYTTLYDAFASIGVTLTWELQTQIASTNGISSYTGTAEQNETILSLLKAGTLLNPNYVEVSYYAACDSSCTTFYEGMSNIGIDCDWTLHCEIAAANGMTDFSGTAEENTTLLELLKAGKLIIPGTSSSDSSSSSGSSSSVSDGKTGYDRGYVGGMAGTGEYKAFGLDVSSWQGSDLNFTRIKNAGYDYVILRAGTSNGKDTCFETYYQNAKAAGLDVGAYYYSYATSVSAVQADMEDFLSYIDGKTYEYPIYFDYEDSTQQALSSSLSQEICLTAMDMLAAEGYLVGMYTGKYFSTQLPMDTICAKYEVWIAHYLAVGDGTYDGTGDYWKYGPTYASQYGMYQFTDSVWISGYGPYDGDVCYKDYPTIVKTYGFNGYTVESTESDYITKNCTFYPAHCTIEVTTANNLYTEPRSASDVIEEAPLGTTYVANGLYVNGGGNLWYRVTTSSGDYGYIYSGRVKYVDQVTADVTVTDYDLPSNHVVGNVFVVNGNISSTYNQLGNVSVYIYSGNTTSGTPVTGDSAASSNNKYSLSGSTIDDGTSFGDLATGTYTYVISADYTNYYAASTKELATNSGTIKLVTHVFSVVTEGSSGGDTTESTYFDKCTFYPSRVKFTTNRDTGIFSEPRTAKTGNTSVQLEEAPNGTTYTSIGLYVNSGSNIFYEVLTSDGQKGYIYSGYTDFVKKAYDDIKLSGADLPNGHVEGNVFLVTGTISSSYNTLGTAKVYIYSGFGVDGDPITGGTASVTDNRYVLDSSSIDDATSFGDLPTGTYTYYIGVTFSSYYAESAKVLGTVSGTRTLKKHYFTVVDSAVDQSSCSHSNTETIIEEPTCTATGTKVTSCSICGLTEKGTAEALGHSYGSYTVTVPATCTTAGSKEKVCSRCDKVYTKAIAATGHSYNVVTLPATCTEYAIDKYTCSSCGDTYTKYAGEYTDWSTTKPDVDEALIETKTQYRYKDYETLTSYEADLEGYTLLSSEWEQTGTGSVTYVKSWPSGFPTSSNTYATYNKIGDKVTASETDTDKTEVNSDALVGYLWYHWCSYGGDTSTSYETNTNWCFHVFFSTTTPSQADNYDSSDGSYKLSSSTQCPYCVWYWPVAVYTQDYTTYQNKFTYERWTSWSSWSDDVATASDTRQVKTRTVYRYIDTQLGDHTWNNGVVTTAATCTTAGVKTYTCTSCSTTKTESIAASGHNWSGASCTQPSTCSTCGATSGNALGHSYTSKVTTAPTCTANGVRTYTCSTCSSSYTETISRLGHSYSGVVTAPTCTEQGYTTYTCSTCGSSYKDNYTNAINHSYTSKVTTPATCTSAGVKTYTCGNCSDSYTEMISATGHNYISGKCSNCGDTKVVTLTGSFNDWGGVDMVYGPNGYTYSMELAAGNYTFKLIKDGSWLGNNGTIEDTTTATSDVGWEFTAWGGDCTLVTTGGTYYFTFIYDTNMLVITSDHTHSYNAGEVIAPTCTTAGYTVYTCACGHSYNGDETAALGHSYVGGKCSACGDTKVVTLPGDFNSWETVEMTWTANGYTYVMYLDAGTYKFKLIKDGTWLGNNGTIEDTTTATSNIGWEFADWGGDCTLNTTGGTYYFSFNYDTNMLVITFDHTHVYTAGEVVAPTCTTAGYTVYTCACGDSYNGDETAALGHNWNSGEITTTPGCETTGVKTYTCGTCGETKTEAVAASGHSYTAKVTAPTCTAKGYTTYTCSCGDTYVADEVAALGHDYKSVVTVPTCTEQGYTTHNCSRCSDNYVDTYTDALGHNWNSGEITTTPGCETTGVKTYTCGTCGETKTEAVAASGHSYSGKVTAPTCTEAGYTTYTCSVCGDSYVADEVAALGHDYKSVVTAPICTAQGYTTHTCSVCGDSYVDSYVDATGHSFTDGICTGCGCYALQHTGASLTLENEIKYNLYFYLNDSNINVADVGLLTFLSEPTDATLANADHVLHNLFLDAKTGYYALQSQGVAAKNMADAMYLRLYVELEDGTVIYGKLLSYSAQKYTDTVLASASSSETLKNVVVALMNYGAEAQKRFNYNTDSLMNANLTAEQQAGQVSYSADLLDARVKAADSKIGSLIATDGAFSTKSATVTLEGALKLNFFFLPGKTVDNGTMTMYYWTASTYASVDELTLDNADGSMAMTMNGSYYQGVYDDIAAKEIDDTVYVLAVYESEGETCMSGIVSYSIEHYCRSEVTNQTANQAVCEALTIYSYFTKIYFNVD